MSHRSLSDLNLAYFEAFLFDLDGTLIDGSDRHFIQCVYETGVELGIPDLHIPPGTPLTKFLQTRIGERGAEFIANFKKRNKERMLNTPRPVSFHEDTISFIQKYKMKQRALVTNCNNWELQLTEDVLDLRSIFEFIFYKSADVAAKPAADLYLKAAKALQRKPEKCLVFEDSATGIASGKNAGMTVVGIDRGTHRNFHEADYVVQSFEEILKPVS